MKLIKQRLMYIFILFFLANCQNPVPILTSISPDLKAAHFPTFILAAFGSDFLTNSKIVFDGVEKPTTFVDSTKLTCEVNPADIATGGIMIPVLVRTPSLGGGDSITLNFTVVVDPDFPGFISISNPGLSLQPDIAADKVGRVNVVWSQMIVSGIYGINFRRSVDKGATWNQVIDITNMPCITWNFEPVIAVDCENIINVVWNHEGTPDNLQFIRSSYGIIWTAPVVPSGNLDPSVLPAIAIDNLNYIYLAWREGYDDPPTEIYFSRSTNYGANWSPVINLSNIPEHSTYPSIAADDSGNVYVVWQEDTPSDLCYLKNIYFNRSSDYGVTWSTAVQITFTDKSGFPDIAVDKSGNIHVVFHVKCGQTCSDVFYIRSTDKGCSWSAPVNISNHPRASTAAIVVDSADNINVVWQESWSVTGGDIYFCRSINNSQTWSQPINISDSSFASSFAKLSVDEEGNIYIVWEERIQQSNHWEIYFTQCVY